MNVYEKHADSLRSLQIQLGDDCPTLFFNGKLINILPGGAKFKREGNAGGFSLDADLSLTCLAEDFGVETADDAKALSKKPFTYPGEDGPKFAIVDATLMPTGIQLRITANSAGKL